MFSTMTRGGVTGEAEMVETRDRKLTVLGSVGIGIGLLPVIYKLAHMQLGFASSIPPAFLYLGIAILTIVLVVGAARALLWGIARNTK